MCPTCLKIDLKTASFHNPDAKPPPSERRKRSDRLAAQHLRDERRRRDRGAAPEPAHPPTAGEGVLAGLSVQRYLVKSKQHLGNVANRAKFSRARSRLYRSLLL